MTNYASTLTSTLGSSSLLLLSAAVLAVATARRSRRIEQNLRTN